MPICPDCGKLYDICSCYIEDKKFDPDVFYKEKIERADDILFKESHGLTDYWLE